MADRPILMSAPMVRATIAGTKSQTRRIFPYDEKQGNRLGVWEVSTVGGGKSFDSKGRPVPEMPCVWHTRTGACFVSKYKIGDRLWVRETFATTAGGPILYAATDDIHELRKKKPSIFMPMYASRLTLEVVDVRIERLQEISEADALAEGIWTFIEGNSRQNEFAGFDKPEDRLQVIKILYGSPQNAYRHLWESINGTNSWEKNPFVVVVGFRTHKCNIANVERRAA